MNKRNLYYPTGEEVRVGDIVRYGDTQGRIVFIVNTDSYSDNYPKEEWDYLEEGFGVETEKYGLIHDMISSEDLQLIKRNSPSDIRHKISQIEANALEKLLKENSDSPDDIA